MLSSATFAQTTTTPKAKSTITSEPLGVGYTAIPDFGDFKLKVNGPSHVEKGGLWLGALTGTPTEAEQKENHVIGTKTASNLFIKTNGEDRFRVGDGTAEVYVNAPTGDGFTVRDFSKDKVAGTDLVWIKSYNRPRQSSPGKYDDVGLLMVSNYDWPNPLLAVRESGKIFMGVNYTNFQTPSCTDCDGYRLFVKDGIRTEQIKVDVASVNNWADYVFEKDYQLMPLPALKAYVNENKHLPEVPSAQEVVDNGLELKAMNTLLLKKVEELTLYVIKLNEEVSDLKTKAKN
jgi:hypothetical protein